MNQTQTLSDPRDSKAFYATVASLIIPIALQNLINTAVQAADVIMLGLVGEVVLSAASLAGQVQFVMMLIFFGLGSGASVLTAQYWGKGDARTIEKVISIALRLSMMVAFVFFAAAELIPGVLMRIFTSDPELIQNGVIYLRIVAPGYLFTGFSNLYLIIMRSVERVKISVVVYSVSLLVNVALNAVLIFGLLGFPAMGIAGAALATTIARLGELVITGVYAAKNTAVHLRRRDFTHWHPQLMVDFRKYSVPTILNEGFWGLAISTNAVIIGHLGAQAVAANSVAQVMRQLAMVVCFGIAGAAGILAGKALGAGRPDLALAYSKRLTHLTLLAGAAGAGLILLARPVVLAVMNLSPQASAYLSLILLVLSGYVLFQAYNTTMIVGIFRAGGDIRFGLILDVCTMWLGSILWAALGAFVFHWPVEVVLVVIMVDEFIKVPIVFWRNRKRVWLRNVTRDL